MHEAVTPRYSCGLSPLAPLVTGSEPDKVGVERTPYVRRRMLAGEQVQALATAVAEALARLAQQLRVGRS